MSKDVMDIVPGDWYVARIGGAWSLTFVHVDKTIAAQEISPSLDKAAILVMANVRRLMAKEGVGE